MRKLFIRGKRNGYGPEQCGRSLTVRELIAELEQYDGNATVFLSNDNGYTYGSITERDIWEPVDDEDENNEEVE